MNTAARENPSPSTPTPQVQHRGATVERQLSIDQLARAVGEHALRQAEIDQKIATRLLEFREELSNAKDEIRSLRSQVDQLVQGLSQGLALAQSRSVHATQSALQASVASLRNR
jgi:DNA-binding ferritin-like protein